MIVIRLMGGLGNQLQQYALYEKFISLGRDAYIDTSWFGAENQPDMAAPRKMELELFEEADFCTASEAQIRKLLGRSAEDSFAGRLFRLKNKILPGTCGKFTESGMYHPEIFDMPDAYLEGYWAAEKYYADILDILRKKLKFGEPDEENLRMAEEIVRGSRKNKLQCGSSDEPADESRYTCSVHIRRGDYLDAVNREMFGNICTDEYYSTAFEYMRKKHPGVIFYVFSDDSEYVSKNFSGLSDVRQVNINSGENSRYDMYLMSLCDGHICANSTFSFWGVRFDPDWNPTSGECPDAIRPAIHKNSQVFVPEEMHDLWKGWILIDQHGNER